MNERSQKYLELITAAHDPAALQAEGMVAQCWEDGEITLQKSGSLLWQRILHSIDKIPGIAVPIDKMPVVRKTGESHGYAAMSYEAADKIYSHFYPEGY